MLYHPISLCSLQLLSHELYPAAALTLSTLYAGRICNPNPSLPHPQVQLLPSLSCSPQSSWQQSHSLSCRDWYLLCTIPLLYSINWSCFGEAQYCIQELILLNYRPVCLCDYWSSHKGIRASKSGCDVQCYTLPADWTISCSSELNHQIIGQLISLEGRDKPLRKKESVTQKFNFPLFLSNVSSTMWLEMCHTVVYLFVCCYEWMTVMKNVSAQRKETVECRCFFFSRRRQAIKQQALIKRKEKSTSVYWLCKGAFSIVITHAGWAEEMERVNATHSSLLLFDISLVNYIFKSLF